MNNLNIESYEIKTSRTDQKIPIVNGVHLHSIYNPFKEAEALTEKHADALKEKTDVLIFGLGFAYHVNEIINYMSGHHGKQFRIVVLEPNMQVYNDCIDQNFLNKKNVIVYAGYTPEELYSDVDLVHFLLSKPTIIAHPPSFNLYQDYFKSVLSFEAPKKISDSLQFITNPKVKRYLSTFNQTTSFKEILDCTIPEKTKLTEYDYLAMALGEMTRGSVSLNTK